MKKVVILISLMMLTSVPTAFAGIFDWLRDTVVVEKIITVPAPVEGWIPSTPMGWLTWLILVLVFANFLKGRKLPQAIVDRMPVFPKKAAATVGKVETPAEQQ